MTLKQPKKEEYEYVTLDDIKSYRWFYCQPQSPGFGIWGLGIGDQGLTIRSIKYFLCFGFILVVKMR